MILFEKAIRARLPAKPPRREGLGQGLLMTARWMGWCLGLLLEASLLAEPLRYAQYDFWQTSDGLPHHDVISLAQTDDGYLWAGTRGFSNSVVRFNGKELIPVFKLPAVAGHMGTTLATGQDGRLWMAKAGESHLLRWERGQLERMELKMSLANEGSFIALLEDRHQNLWIGGQGLLVRTSGGQIKNLSGVTNQIGSIRGMAEDRQGAIWLAASQGLGRFRGDTFDCPYPVPPNLLAVCSARNGSLWLGCQSEEAVLEIKPSGEIRSYGAAQGLTAKGVRVIYEDAQSTLWLGTYTGLCYIRDGQVYGVQEHDLRTAYIFSLLQDREGSLWAGTADGLYRMGVVPFENYGPPEGLGPVNSLYAGPSGLWATVYGRGIYLYRDQGWKHIELGGNDQASQLVQFNNLVEFPAGELWFGSDGRCYHRRQGKTELVDGIQGNVRFCTDGEGVWIITSTGLYYARQGTMTQAAGDWPPMEVTALTTNRNGGLLIGTAKGVSEWSSQDQMNSWFRFNDDFSGQRVNSLEWEEDTLWFASDVALGRFQSGRWQVIRAEAGLEETGGINNLLVDRHNLWLGCNKGLFRVDRMAAEECLQGAASRVNLVHYDRTRGVRPGFFGPGEWGQGTARTPDGRLWFASKNWVVAVNTAVPLNSKPPPVVIESIKVNQRPVAIQSGGEKPSLRIPPGATSIEIEFTALTYIAVDRVKYKYRLLGLESDWSPLSSTRSAHFSRLTPGAYEFQVTACNSDGIWSERVACLSLIQEPFFHQTRTFQVLCLGAAILILLGASAVAGWISHVASTRRMRQRLASLEAQRGLDQERTRIARDIHDDLGSTLTRIVLLTELCRREPSAAHTPNGHLTAIQTAAREITGRLDEIVWAINPRNDTLDAFMTYLSKTLADQARLAGLRCRFEVPTLLPPWPLSGSVRHHLYLAGKEAIHNALKHAQPNELRLRLELRDDVFELEISDDGVGLPATPSSKPGNGLINLRDRLTALGGQCLIQSAPAQGTTVTFRVPRTNLAAPVSTIRATCKI